MTRHHHNSSTVAQPAAVKPPNEPKTTFSPVHESQAQRPKVAGEETTRLRAYEKWEAAGMPQGNEVQFWLDAEQELLAAEEGRFSLKN